MNKLNAIGIIGGVGPMAGLDLFSKVISHTKANKDQEHLNVILTSCPSLIPDRTEYLLSGAENPAPGIQKCVDILACSGASVIGLGCNTAHSPKILNQINFPQGVSFINMIESTCAFLEKKIEGKVGLIATLGTIKTGIYAQYFEKYSLLELVVPDEETCKMVHNAIYDKEYGIKAKSPVSDKARKDVFSAVAKLRDSGCKAIILGCTELPLVFNGIEAPFEDLIYANPTEILAIELIKKIDIAKLL